eukprot:TRINITY_DN9296_c0_g1_i1.p1 TRINITY_DN9296_c0_g1~~TRINITY_DN9296_c0_g1_i1.p1  ORF type:complete len:185 (+),score=39.90 TRINITY_DN9296_c0_g1_i1:150-704(+)
MIKLNMIGEYRLGFKLGNGTDGSCYLATKQEKEYCIKVIHVKKDDNNKRSRIMMEVEALRKLQGNENIITLHETMQITDSKNNKDIFCLVTDVMPMNLLQYMQKYGGKLSEAKCKKICLQIISALVFCHQKLIVHNDIKFENITIDPKTLKIKLIDFGMSVVCKNETEIKNLNKVHGTPFFFES